MTAGYAVPHQASRCCTPRDWTLGDFLQAATKHLNATLPPPGRRPRRQPLNFSPRHGRSTTAAHIGHHWHGPEITHAEMKAYDGVFATPLPLAVISAIAALVDREIPHDLGAMPIPGAPCRRYSNLGITFPPPPVDLVIWIMASRSLNVRSLNSRAFRLSM